MVTVLVKGDAPAAYTQEKTYEIGTLKSDVTAYNAYLIAEKMGEAGFDSLQELNVVAIGDSYMFDSNVKPNMWIELLTRKYNMTLTNYGNSGSTMAKHADTEDNSSNQASFNPMVDRVVDAAVQYQTTETTIQMPTTPDESVQLVFLEGGRNDFSKGRPLGDLSAENVDPTTVRGAINLMVAKLQELYPNALIVGLTPWACNSEKVTIINGGSEMTQTQYAQGIYEMYELLGVPCFNNADKELSGVDMDSWAFREQFVKDTDDVSHLAASGALAYLPKIEAFVAAEMDKKNAQ